MKRMFGAGLLALPFLLTLGQESRAQYASCPQPTAQRPSSCAACGNCGVGGFCFRFLGSIHQHGPLFNYGPYYGYYPFEPYGPWNAQLQYTGPRPGDYNGACGPIGLCGKCGGYHGRFAGCGAGSHGCGAGGCSSGAAWGAYASTTWKNVFHRVHPFAHRFGKTAAPCGSCAGSAGYTDGAIISSKSPDRDHPSEIQTTGYPRRER